ncbi:exonuclease domain-containing protein, partial [Kitasatospora sp. NPDC057512]|uniref:exonuclease domain-containing protein n=1 Tax=Kitasatospora sp. NPDC057512 TaxID=3346154 RepID=UPI0036BD17F7
MEELMRDPRFADTTLVVIDFEGLTPAGRPAEPIEVAALLATAPPAAQVMAGLDAHLSAPPYRLVAHHAHTEAGLIAHQAEHCPVLAATPLLDTIGLAKAVLPHLGSYRLDNLLGHYGIPRPADRHRAMPDVQVTAKILELLLAEGCAPRRWRTQLEL